MNTERARMFAVVVLLAGIAAGFFAVGVVAPSFPFRLGLDLQGGTHLVYSADVSQVARGEVKAAMEGLRDVIERRVNLFGVTEPIVQVNTIGDEQRLVVEIAGVKDINEAITLLGETPFLEFRTERPEGEREAILEAQRVGERLGEDPFFIPTELTGRYLKRAELAFDPVTFQPIINISFDEEGSRIFERLTQENTGKQLAIYLDGAPISAPIVREQISGGQAQISGDFTANEAKQLVGRLNSGALPVPITLISQQSVEASLSNEALARSMQAGLYGLVAVTLFMILWYRLPGVLAALALLIYVALVLSLFKLIPVTLTAAGVAGFILSIGIAVDANILIFERFKEEIKNGREIPDALREGFLRAFPSIRDANVSSLITAAILYWFGTSLIRGFAVTLFLGILVSLFSAIIITRTFLRALTLRESKTVKKLFGV